MKRLIVGLLFVIPTATVASAGMLDVNLVVNGDAETDDTSGWTSNTGLETTSAAAAGSAGLPVGTSIGSYSFTGALGGNPESMAQSIDVSALAGRVDSGEITSHFSILLQSRSADTADAELRFLNAVGGIIQSAPFQDPPTASTWQLFTDTRLAPVGTRAIEIELTGTRSGGVSTDAFFDNVTLTLTPEPATLVLLSVGAVGFLRRRRPSRT